MKTGKLFVISAPSGSGKTTLCRRLIRSFSGKRRLVRSVSATTRKRRKGELSGRDYFFISQAAFLQKRGRGQFLEWARVLGNFYGTPRSFVQGHIRSGDDVLLSIDVQGASKLKRSQKQAVFIFIKPPSFQELKVRLCGRSTEDTSEIARRLKLARREMQSIKQYDYVVLNDKIEKALLRLKRIIIQERKK
ncbi:guanylate kinase [Candidatus Omnitrophota bacterium]